MFGPAPVALDNPRADRVTTTVLIIGLFLLGPVVSLAPLGLAPLAIVTALLLSVPYLVRQGWNGLPRGQLTRLLALLCLLGAASMAWTINPARTLPAALSLAAIVLPGLVLVSVASGLNGPRCRSIEDAFLIGLGVGVALLLVQVAFGHSFGELLSHRALPGTITPKAMSRPGTTLALMVWPAAIILYRRGWVRLAWLLPAGYAALTPLLHHRASVVAMAGALVVLVAATKAPVMTRRILAGILTLLFVGAVPIAEGLHQAGLEDAAWLPSSARHRVEIWQFTADRVLEQPLTGVGLDASGSIGNHGLLSRFQEPGTTIIPLHPHSVFLQIWVELGLPGVVLALGVALGLLAALVRVGTGSLQPFALAGFTSCWIISAMSFGAWQAWWLGAILLSAAALALSCRADHP